MRHLSLKTDRLLLFNLCVRCMSFYFFFLLLIFHFPFHSVFFFMCEIILSPSILQLAMAECRKVLASALSVAQLISVRSALNACDSDGGRDG